MIYLGTQKGEKLKIVEAYIQKHDIKKVYWLTTDPIENNPFEEFSWSDVIQYKHFYRLLQEIDSSTLIVIDEFLRTQNRYDLTYNCVRNYLNQTKHQVIFQYLPIIDTREDFMILFDFETQSMWKREKYSKQLIQKVEISCNPIQVQLQKIEVETDKKTKQRYEREKAKRFAELGNKDPHTIPRNLYLIGGKQKMKSFTPDASYVARNQRLKSNQVKSIKNVSKGNYVLVEFPHRFIDFTDYLWITGQEKIDVLVADLKVDQWYWERFKQWESRLQEFYKCLE